MALCLYSLNSFLCRGFVMALRLYSLNSFLCRSFVMALRLYHKHRKPNSACGKCYIKPGCDLEASALADTYHPFRVRVRVRPHLLIPTTC